MVRSTSKGVVLFIVLSMILIVVVLANIILTFILSQSRLTRHQTGRIQAHYAVQAGINYALEKLRLGNDPSWPATGTYTHTLCRSGCDINEPDLPNTVQRVDITIGLPSSGINGTRKIDATAIYTYQES